ncbi:MAG: hypothetical protein ACRD28_13835, partial [Acidobacteriaceae bacterium]
MHKLQTCRQFLTQRLAIALLAGCAGCCFVFTTPLSAQAASSTNVAQGRRTNPDTVLSCPAGT